MPPRKLLLFGSIGTLAETSEWQREAFNRAFEQAGLDWQWDQKTYRSLLRISGGKNRVALYAASVGATIDAAQVHDLKTRIYNGMLAERPLTPRPGVGPVVDWAAQNGIALGLASTTSRENIDALFHALKAHISRGKFTYVGDRSRVAKTKPAPDIYLDALAATGLTPADCLAIEDTKESLDAARNAGIQVIAFPGENSAGHEFSTAAANTDSLSPDVIGELFFGGPGPR